MLAVVTPKGISSSDILGVTATSCAWSRGSGGHMVWERDSVLSITCKSRGWRDCVLASGRFSDGWSRGGCWNQGRGKDRASLRVAPLWCPPHSLASSGDISPDTAAAKLALGWGCSTPKAVAQLLVLHLLSGSRTLCSEDGSPAPFTSMKLCLEILMGLAASGGKEELLGVSKCDIC